LVHPKVVNLLVHLLLVMIVVVTVTWLDLSVLHLQAMHLVATMVVETRMHLGVLQAKGLALVKALVASLVEVVALPVAGLLAQAVVVLTVAKLLVAVGHLVAPRVVMLALAVITMAMVLVTWVVSQVAGTKVAWSPKRRRNGKVLVVDPNYHHKANNRLLGYIRPHTRKEMKCLL
jgi:hypothetical protein